jgi:putative peptidoglycan lipid II flippase
LRPNTVRRYLPAWLLAARARFLPDGAILLTVLTFGSYVAGLVAKRSLARTFGAGEELDAFNAAFVFPEVTLDVLVASGLAAPFIPLFLGLKSSDEEAAHDFGRTVMTLAILVMAVAAGVLFVLAPQTASVVAEGFTPGQRALYTDLFRVMLVTVVIFAASMALGEILVAERRFLAYGLAPILYNAGIVVGAVALGGQLGIFGPAVGAVLGAILHLGVRLWGIRATGFRPRPAFAVRTRALVEFGRLMLPKMASHPIEPVMFGFFTRLASGMAAGSVSALNFARDFQSVPVSLIGASLSLAAFPALSTAYAMGDRRGFARILGTNVAAVGGLTVLAGLFLLAFSPLVVRVFLGGGAFDEADVALTAATLAAFAISVPFDALAHPLARAVYATRNTSLQVVAALAGFAVAVATAGALAEPVGLAAIPLGFAAGSATKVALLAVALVARVRAIGRDAVATDLAEAV